MSLKNFPDTETQNNTNIPLAAQTLYELIQNRRSIRQYKTTPVPHKVLLRILEAGTWAPSGKNLQNWRFVILQNDARQAYLEYSQASWQSIRPLLEKRLKPNLYAFTERFFYTLGNAPVVILAYSKPHPEEHPQTTIGSVYMAVQNMLLAAQAEGLGTCPMGAPLEVKEAVNAFLDIDPTQYDLVCGLTLGYPDHAPPAAPRQQGRYCWHT
jgi:nitroreductase